MEKISISFLNELFLLCFHKKDIVSIVAEHLKYTYIPDEFSQYKKILKSIITTYKNEDKLPSFGLVAQQYQQDLKVQETLLEIKETDFADKELIITALQEIIKKSQFISLNTKLKVMYNDGLHEEAINLQAKESEQIVNFSLRNTEQYLSRIYGDFNKRVEQRAIRAVTGEDKLDKVAFGIEPLDIITEGGMDATDTALLIMRSGVGKSTWLKWMGVEASRKHRNVLHIQLEGSQEECEIKYDQVWTATLYNDIRKGNIDDKRYEHLQKIINYMKSYNNDIYVHAYEQFNTASMNDVRSLAVDFQKQGPVDLIIIDYLKYLHPGDGINYGVSVQETKMKKENCSDRIKNVAKELGTRVIIADQASDVSKEIWNDPSKALTRHNIAGAKNLPDSYSFVFTGNQTEEERKNNLIRIYADKVRHYKLPDSTIKMATAYNYGRFYDYKRTRDLFWNNLTSSYEF